MEKGDTGGFNKRKRISLHHRAHNQRGFTLFEIFLAMLILAVSIIPMLNAFAPTLLSSNREEEQTILIGRARQTMNRVLAMDFRTIDDHQGNPADLVALFGSSAEAEKETLVYKGQTYVPVVTISDASGGQGSLLELTVTLQTARLQTLKSAY